VWKIGNDKKVRFWLDNWCATKSLRHVMELDDSSQDVEFRFEQFITSDRTWNVTRLSQFLPTHLIAKVCATPILINDMKDSFCWGLSSLGEQNLQLEEPMVNLTCHLLGL